MDEQIEPRKGCDFTWWAVVLVSLGAAIALYAQFRPEAHSLWWSPSHDRNAHYWAAQNVGLDLRSGNVVHLGVDVERMRIWGPLHPLVTGLLLAFTGVDYRYAAVTALLSWAGTAIFAFSTARRITPSGGNAAGFVAAALVLLSPAQRAYATDIMLEAPGAFLSLAAVYAYLRVRQTPSKSSYRWFAISLSGLFFLKYNYWILAVAALIVAELLRWRYQIVPFAGRIRDALPAPREWLVAQIRHPLTYILLAVAAILAVYALRGPYGIPLGSRSIQVRTADTLVTVGWGLILLRIAPWWLRSGRRWLRDLSTPAYALAIWHVWPVAFWFLMPKRATLFVSYLTRDHGIGEGGPTFAGRFAAYLRTIAHDYHTGAGVACAVAVLALIAFLGVRRLRPGAAFLFTFIAVAVALTAAQSCGRSRFLHSWMPLVWVASGVGFSLLVSRMVFWLRYAVTTLALGAAVLCGWPSPIDTGHSPEGGVDSRNPSALPIPESYLPELAGARRVLIASNNPLKFFATWTYQDRYGGTDRVMTEAVFPEGTAEFVAWAVRNKIDAVVWIDIAPGSPWHYEPEVAGRSKIKGAMTAESDFTALAPLHLPDSGATIFIWQRTNAGDPPR